MAVAAAVRHNNNDYSILKYKILLWDEYFIYILVFFSTSIYILLFSMTCGGCKNNKKIRHGESSVFFRIVLPILYIIYMYTINYIFFFSFCQIHSKTVDMYANMQQILRTYVITYYNVLHKLYLHKIY